MARRKSNYKSYKRKNSVTGSAFKILIFFIAVLFAGYGVFWLMNDRFSASINSIKNRSTALPPSSGSGLSSSGVTRGPIPKAQKIVPQVNPTDDNAALKDHKSKVGLGTDSYTKTDKKKLDNLLESTLKGQ